MGLKDSGNPYVMGPGICADSIAAAHSAQMEATIAAIRADHDAKIAELMADLEGTRAEKESADTELAYLKASARKERLVWNQERTLLSRKLAEAEGRARETADGVASPEEFVALQQGLASRTATIEDLRAKLRAKEAICDRLQFEASCDATRDDDLDRLMVRVASLESALAEEKDMRKSAEVEVEAKEAETRSLERRLTAALAAAASAEEEAATCVEDAAKAIDEVREARAARRHAELWLEKSLAEVDAVHSVLEYSDRTTGPTTVPVGVPATPSVTSAAVPHLAQTPHPPSPAYMRTRHRQQQQQQQQQQQLQGVEVDDVHSILECSDHITGPATGPVGAPAAPSATTVAVPHLTQTPHPPSLDYIRARQQQQQQQELHGAVGPGAQTPYPPSPATIQKGATGRGKIDSGVTGRGHSASALWSQDSPLATPDHRDVTIPPAFVALSHLGSSGGTIRDWKDEHDCSLTMEDEGEGDAGPGAREAHRRRFNTLSPSTPKVLFQEMVTDRRGGSMRGRCRDTKVPLSFEKVNFPLNGNAGYETGLHATLDAISANGGEEHPLHHRPGIRDFSNSDTSFNMGGSASAAASAANGEAPGGGNKNLASLLRWHSFFLRYEIRRREKAEARAVELEVQAKHAAVEKGAASEGAPTDDPWGPPLTRETERTANGNLSSGGGVADGDGNIVNDTRQRKDCCCGACGGGGHHSLTLPGATCTSIDGVNADCYAHFARVDQERQKEKILDLVREARSKIVGTALENKIAGDETLPSGWESGATINGSKRGGRGPSTEEGLWPTSNRNLFEEMASLIYEFEEKLSSSIADNTQLMEFCTHLEGLLANHGHDNPPSARCSAGVGLCGNGEHADSSFAPSFAWGQGANDAGMARKYPNPVIMRDIPGAQHRRESLSTRVEQEWC